MHISRALPDFVRRHLILVFVSTRYGTSPNSDVVSFEVASRFLENLCTSAHNIMLQMHANNVFQTSSSIIGSSADTRCINNDAASVICQYKINIYVLCFS